MAPCWRLRNVRIPLSCTQSLNSATKTACQSADIVKTCRIWLIYFITSTQEVVVRVLDPFVTSSFDMHSFTAALTIVSSIVGGLSKLPLAKILDTWGRPQGLALALSVWVIGLVMMAGCNSVATYLAAEVFSVVG